jgi:hypothetical protein
MTTSELADLIIISVAIAFVINAIANVSSEIANKAIQVKERRARLRLHKRWVAARVAAREETEAKLRAEGRWDNYEIQAAMKAAGEAAAPGYRP